MTRSQVDCALGSTGAAFRTTWAQLCGRPMTRSQVDRALGSTGIRDMSGWSGRSNKPTLRPILQQRGSQQRGSAAESVASPRSGSARSRTTHKHVLHILSAESPGSVSSVLGVHEKATDIHGNQSVKICLWKVRTFDPGSTQCHRNVKETH